MYEIIEPGFEYFEWDENKNQINIQKHMIDFDDAKLVLRHPHFGRPVVRNQENRIIAIGYIDNLEITIVYTVRGIACRIISARRARKHEREACHTLYG